MDILNYRVASLLKMEKLTNLNIPYSVYRKKQKDAKIKVTIKINAHIIILFRAKKLLKIHD